MQLVLNAEKFSRSVKAEKTWSEFMVVEVYRKKVAHPRFCHGLLGYGRGRNGDALGWHASRPSSRYALRWTSSWLASRSSGLIASGAKAGAPGFGLRKPKAKQTQRTRIAMSRRAGRRPLFPPRRLRQRGGARHVVASAPYGDLQIVVASETHGRDHVGGPDASGDQARAPVNGTVPDCTGDVVVGVVGTE
jgi:hypothetical protein